MTARYDVVEKDIVGKRLESIIGPVNDEDVTFNFEGATSPYRMFHCQDCCECVEIENIEGDLTDLVGQVITEFSEEIDPDGPRPIDETVTRYTFVAEDGTRVVMNWLGSSNGYYSEVVTFERTEQEGDL